MPGTNDCKGDFGMQMSHGPLAPRTFCEPPAGLVGSHFLDGTQMQRIPSGDGTGAGHARSPTEVNEKCPDCLNTGPSARPQAPVESECLPEICDPVPDARCGILSKGCNGVQASRSWHAKLLELQGQPAGKEEGSESRDENVPLPVPKSTRVVSGRRHHRLRMLVDHSMCRNEKFEKLLLER